MKTIESKDRLSKYRSGYGKGADKAAKGKARGNRVLLSSLKFGKNRGSSKGFVSGKSRGQGKGRGPMNRAGNTAPGNVSSNTKNADISAGELETNPKVLQEAAEAGVAVSDLDLKQEKDGMLTEDSKKQVNKLIGNLSSSIDSEVAAMVFNEGDGRIGTNVYTSNKREAVSFDPPDNVIYDAHTHPDNDRTPSQTDIDNKIPGSEATVVPADNTVGNETGEYVKYKD